MKTYDDIAWEHQRDESPDLGNFYLMERRYWVVKCRKCNHQVMGTVPQTDRARRGIVNHLRDLKCKNCIHEAEKAAAQ